MISDVSTSVAGLSELMERVRRRIWIQSALKGTAETVSILIAGVLLSCGLDYLLSLPGLFRLAFLAITLFLTAIIAARRLIIPVLQVPPADEIGAAVDLEFPELQESVATLISIQQSDVTNDVSTRLMLERLRQSVEEHIQVARPSAIVKSRSTIRRCAMAGVAMVIILIPTLLWPTGSGLLAQRFVMPFANLAAASNFYLEIPNGNRIAARNTDVEFAAIPKWRNNIPGKTPTDVVLELRTESGVIDEMPMLLNSEQQQFTAVLRSARESLRYRVFGGGAMTEWFQLTVGDPPVVQTATLTSFAPAYTRRAPVTFEGASGDMEVLVGSQIEIRLAFNEPVHDVRITWSNWKLVASDSRDEEAAIEPATKVAQAIKPAELTPDGLSVIFRFEAQGGGDFDLIAFNKAGLCVANETARRLIVLPDAPPTLSVGGIEDGMRVRPDEVLTVECGAADDIGIGALNMQYRLNPANSAEPQADLVDALTAEAELETTTISAEPLNVGSLIVSHNFTLDLKALNARSGESLTVTVCTQDERPVPGPQVVCQGPWTIYIDDEAPPGGESSAEAARRKLLEDLERIDKQLEQDAKDAEELKEQIEKEQNEDTQEKAEELSEQEKQLAEELKELAEKSEPEQMTPEQKQKLKELSEQLADDAAKKLEEAAKEESETAAKKVDEAAKQLGKVREELEQIADDVGTVDSPKDSGNTSQFDGKTPSATAPGGKPRDWGKLQDELEGANSDAGKDVLDSEYADLIRRYRRDLARTGEPTPAPEQKK
ncbi:MAG: hypothetical protein U0936_12695 [Planctomycetaceae bacterium]